MSLRFFHLLFVAASFILALGFAVWCVDAYASRGEAGDLVLGILSAVLAAGLAVYGLKVRKKLKEVMHEDN